MRTLTHEEGWELVAIVLSVLGIGVAIGFMLAASTYY